MPSNSSTTLVTGWFDTTLKPFHRIITVPLEAQGVPADIANHRRSVNATESCQANVTIERYDKRIGKRRSFVVRCQNPAISLDEAGINRCAEHRLTK
jgi:hypothetical protein